MTKTATVIQIELKLSRTEMNEFDKLRGEILSKPALAGILMRYGLANPALAFGHYADSATAKGSGSADPGGKKK
jgi:hypothetical protein